MGSLTKADIPGIFNATTALTAAYTVVAADRGKLFDCSGTFTITITAAATLGAGFSFAVRNSGTGIITLDPNAAELVDGVATITYAAGVSSLVTCNGTAFKSVGLTGTGIVSGVAIASIAGTSIDFTGIPSWVKKVTMMFSGMSTNGTSPYLIQIGTSGGIETAGYLSNSNYVNNGANSCTGISSVQGIILVHDIAAAGLHSGTCDLYALGGNIWMASGTLNKDSGAGAFFSSTKTLAAILDRIRITTVGGVDLFDAGSINIMYEG